MSITAFRAKIGLFCMSLYLVLDYLLTTEDWFGFELGNMWSSTLLLLLTSLWMCAGAAELLLS